MVPAVASALGPSQDLAAVRVEHDHAAAHRVGAAEDLGCSALQIRIERKHCIAAARERSDPATVALRDAIQIERRTRLGRASPRRGQNGYKHHQWQCAKSAGSDPAHRLHLSGLRDSAKVLAESWK